MAIAHASHIIVPLVGYLFYLTWLLLSLLSEPLAYLVWECLDRANCNYLSK